LVKFGEFAVDKNIETSLFEFLLVVDVKHTRKELALKQQTAVADRHKE